MPYVEPFTATRAPVRMWADPATVESAALDQLRDVANLPWTHGVAVMPDVHHGKGATVGSVIAMRDALCPAAVGVDIGCGMSAVPVRLRLEHLPDGLGPLRAAVEAAIPVGPRGHDTPVSIRGTRFLTLPGWAEFWQEYTHLSMTLDTRRMDSELYRSHIERQLGTLGGGNHFLELCSDEQGWLWLTLHSGSRNVGKEIAERHMKTAAALQHNAGLANRDLAVFVAGTPEMNAYRNDLYWAQEYARRSRAVMLALFQNVITMQLGMVSFGTPVHCHHNYVSEETYDGVDLIITRKGAISTEGGRFGIIPGSMATGSYIVSGLGNPDSYQSASHGAGRRMSRGAAKRNFTIADLEAQTFGVECRKDEGVIDEIPGAYKSIDDVMALQTDLVRVEHRLNTLMCVKG